MITNSQKNVVTNTINQLILTDSVFCLSGARIFFIYYKMILYGKHHCTLLV